MINKPLLTICIPTFKKRNTVEVLMNSIVEQITEDNFSLLEVVVSDNYSNDGTVEYLNTLTHLIPLKIFSNPTNVGMIPNWELAIEKANGKYVWLMGSDDFFNKNAIQKVLSVIQKYNVDLILCNNIYWTPSNHNYKVDEIDLTDSFVRSNHIKDKYVNNIKDLVETRTDIFTPIYDSIMYKQHWEKVFLLYNHQAPFFSSIGNSIPQALYIALNLMKKPGYYIGDPLVISSANISWGEYMPFYMSHILPSLYDIMIKNGADKLVIEKHKKEIFISAMVRWVPDLVMNKLPCSSYFSFFSFSKRFYKDKKYLKVLKIILKNKLK
ncbi:glycosyltransferase family 2 protein [Flavobacterium myungsuense]|uniref:Glycosyltransferase family 2 protein n=1 Tax=Flavobacterium myungsuense TaxID=651823 RepID=A0ABW3J1Z7_9FLAO